MLFLPEGNSLTAERLQSGSAIDHRVSRVCGSHLPAQREGSHASHAGLSAQPVRRDYKTIRSCLSLMKQSRCFSPASSSSFCFARRASARVKYVPIRSSPSYNLYGALGSSLLAISGVSATRWTCCCRCATGRSPTEITKSIFALGCSCSSARRNQVWALSINANSASTVEAVLAIAKHSCA